MSAAHRSSVRWAIGGLAVSLLLIVIKFYGYFLTQSATVLSDAMESSVHVITSSFALFAVWLSAQPGDRNHPYGHGKVEYLSAGLEGGLVLLAGVGIIGIGIKRLLFPVELPYLYLGAMVELIAAVIAFIAGSALMRAGRKNESPTLEADGIHIRSDAFTSFAGFVGVALTQATGLRWIDPALAVVLGVFLIVSGSRVAWSAVGGLLDEWDPALLARISRVFRAVREPAWIAPHAVKVHRLGAAIHIDMHVVFPRYWPLERAHDACHVLIDGLRDEFGERTEPMIHAEACTDLNCALCDHPDCPIRANAFQGLPEWTPDRISRRQRPRVPVESDAAPPAPRIDDRP